MPNSKATQGEQTTKLQDMTEVHEIVNVVRNAFLEKVKNRVDRLAEQHTNEVNIATRYDYRIKLEELISLYNELLNSDIQ